MHTLTSGVRQVEILMTYFYSSMGDFMRSAFIILFASLSVFASELSPIGTWLIGDKDGKVEIYQNGNELEGKVVWIKQPLDEAGKPKSDTKNPDESLRSRSILNLVFLKGFKKEDNEPKWSGGTIYDSKSGKTYKGWIQMVEEKTMKLRGYIGISLLGRTDIWTRDSL